MRIITFRKNNFFNLSVRESFEKMSISAIGISIQVIETSWTNLQIPLRMLKSGHIPQDYISLKEYVELGDRNISNLEPIETDVPQGSVLGLLLFMIFIEDLFYQNLFHKFVIYTDDTTILKF